MDWIWLGEAFLVGVLVGVLVIYGMAKRIMNDSIQKIIDLYEGKSQ